MSTPIQGDIVHHDVIAARALELCERVREHNPDANLAHYTAMCARRPTEAAEIMLALGAWVDVDAPLSQLGDRAEAITRGRRHSNGKPLCP